MKNIFKIQALLMFFWPSYLQGLAQSLEDGSINELEAPQSHEKLMVKDAVFGY